MINILLFLFSSTGETYKSSDMGTLNEDKSLNLDRLSSTKSQVNIQRYDQTLFQSSILVNQHNKFSFSNLSFDNCKSTVQGSSTKRNLSRRSIYDLPLAPVVEHVNDEETDDEFV